MNLIILIENGLTIRYKLYLGRKLEFCSCLKIIIQYLSIKLFLMQIFNKGLSRETLIVSSIVLFILSTAISLVFFSKTTVGSNIVYKSGFNLTDKSGVDEQGSKDQPCPLNGQYYTKNQRDIWEKRPPLAVMVENSTNSRPQGGLNHADVVYEAVAEGGITRFMALFLCQDAGDIQPVRSARTYFLDWLSEYNGALYAHVGGANTPGPANALGQIQDYGIRDMDQFGLGFPTYWRGADKVAPHNVHSTTEKLWKAGEDRKWGVEVDGERWDKDFISWKFKSDTAQTTLTASKIFVPFWTQSINDYGVNWTYNSATNSYDRSHTNTGNFTDTVSGAVVSPKVVIVQFQKESVVNDGYDAGEHLLYGNKGTGEGLLFQDGTVTEIKWNKKTRLDRSIYTDAKTGKEVELNRGQIWIETVPTYSESDVTYN